MRAGCGTREIPEDETRALHVRGNRIRRESEQIIRSLQDQLGDPANWPKLKSSKSTIRISKYNLAWLSRLENETGLRSHNETLTYLVENSRRENMILPASLKLIFHDDRPISLSGPSGTGKSLFLKQVMPNIPGPLFLVDLANEHEGLKKLGFGDYYEIKWV